MVRKRKRLVWWILSSYRKCFVKKHIIVISSKTTWKYRNNLLKLITRLLECFHFCSSQTLMVILILLTNAITSSYMMIFMCVRMLSKVEASTIYYYRIKVFKTTITVPSFFVSNDLLSRFFRRTNLVHNNVKVGIIVAALVSFKYLPNSVESCFSDYITQYDKALICYFSVQIIEYLLACSYFCRR